MITKEEIKPTYEELKGLLSQIPSLRKNPDEMSSNINQLDYFHTIIKKVEKLLPEENLSCFYVNTEKSDIWKQIFVISEYRQKVGGLIMLLYGLFFRDEPEPFGASPSTVVTQNQQQSQAQIISQKRIYYITIGISITISFVVSFLFYFFMK